MDHQRRADAEARAWVARLKNGDVTPEETEAFQAWRDQSLVHERAARQAFELWEIAGHVAEKQIVRSSSRRSFLKGGAVLAASAGAYQGAAVLGYAPTFEALLADQAAPVGRPQPLDFAEVQGTIDGASAVRLNQPGRLKLLDGAVLVRREIAGEGGPLLLEAGELQASLANGACELRFGYFGPEIGCTSGEVHIVEPTKIVLRPGGVVSARSDGGISQATRNIDEIASWRLGVLALSRRRLGDAVTDLNRHRTGKIVFARAQMAMREVSGVFQLNRPDEALSHLVEGLSLNRRDIPGRIVLLS
ncbi:MAG: DUF4880 domain-containing protein [Pseudomonadota bacterium]